jgi:hypothetical protein
MESVVPALLYTHSCSTRLELRNLGERAVDAQLMPHRESGSLVPLAEQSGMSVHLLPGEKRSFTLKLYESTGNAWAAIREIGVGPILSVTGETTCLSGGETRSSIREVARPSTNPWFDRDTEDLPGARLAVVNASASMAVVSGCYSGGTLFSNSNVPGGAALRPLCTNRFQEQLPPYSARQFEVSRNGSSHFSLSSKGSAVALQILRPLDAGLQLFQVDSSITFGQSP